MSMMQKRKEEALQELEKRRQRIEELDECFLKAEELQTLPCLLSSKVYYNVGGFVTGDFEVSSFDDVATVVAAASKLFGKRSFSAHEEGAFFYTYLWCTTSNTDFLLDVTVANVSCKRVQVGTKEVPVYEIQCEKETSSGEAV